MKSNNCIKKVAIANRGEVAVRIIRACQDLGLESVLLHSEVDRETLAYRLATETKCIGPGPSDLSYLNINNNIQAALKAGAQALHPGFGFLSENADFAKACAKNGIIFVGPSPESILAVGDKIQARNLAQKIGVPCIEGFQKDSATFDEIRQAAEKIGYPILLKAAAGGGGRGMRVVRSQTELRPLFDSAQSEALEAFSNPTLFIEKYLESPKHIEVQIFGDGKGNVAVLSERECSVQRRHQKIIEEAPAATLENTVRESLHKSAQVIAQAVNYSGAGTVEFLVEKGRFYFLELNTRLQVEHPVTEMVLSVDLVKWQLQLVSGNWVQPDWIQPRGHSVETRIYAEDPYNRGLPQPGKIEYLSLPQAPGRRFEFGYEAGDVIPQYYDSMIGKIVAWGESRQLAIDGLIRALKDTVIFGVKTNIPLLIRMLDHREFRDGTMSTRFFEKYFSQSLPAPSVPEEIVRAVKSVKGGGDSSRAGARSLNSSKTNSPFFARWKRTSGEQDELKLKRGVSQ